MPVLRKSESSQCQSSHDAKQPPKKHSPKPADTPAHNCPQLPTIAHNCPQLPTPACTPARATPSPRNAHQRLPSACPHNLWDGNASACRKYRSENGIQQSLALATHMAHISGSFICDVSCRQLHDPSVLLGRRRYSLLKLWQWWSKILGWRLSNEIYLNRMAKVLLAIRL